jgi:hypothetical protein
MRIVTEEFIKSLRIGLGIKLHLPFFDNLETSFQDARFDVKSMCQSMVLDDRHSSRRNGGWHLHDLIFHCYWRRWRSGHLERKRFG